MSYNDNMKKISEEAYKNNIPIMGIFELTERCNLRCKFCYMYDRKECSFQKPKFSTEEWLKVIKEAVNMGMIKCILTGGEILSLPDFEYIYSTIYDMGVIITLFTNGLLIDERKVDFLKKRPPDRISMTIYGASNETYGMVTGDKKGYTKAINAINLMKNAGLNIRLRTIAIKPLQWEYKKIKKIAEEFNIPIGFITFLMENRDENINNRLEWRMEPEEILEAYKVIKGTYPNLNQITEESELCTGGITRFGITYDGYLVPCLGFCETRTEPFKLGFEKALTDLRIKLKQENIKCKDCINCGSAKNCVKCPCYRYLETGKASMCSDYLKELSKFGIS